MKLEKEMYINGYEQYKNGFGDSVIQIKLSMIKPTDDIIKHLKNYNHHNVKMTLEYQEPILDEEERKYLSSVIRPFRDRVRYITKYTYDLDGKDKEYISIISYGWTINLPAFKIGTMYKNMELNKEYTLDDLNL